MPRGQRREKGSGSIFKRGDSWIAQVQEGLTESGRPRYRQAACKTKTDAVRALNDMNSLVVQGRAIPDRRGITVAGWLEEWLNEFVRPNREPKTHSFYALLVRKMIPLIGRIELQRLSPSDLSRMYRSLEADGATPNTILAARRTLSAAYGVAMKYGYATDNPAPRTFAPRVRRQKKVFFDSKQIQALLSALEGTSIEWLVKFTLATGLRVGEATGVTWEDVDLEHQSVLIANQLQRVDRALVLKPLKTEKSLRSMPLVGQSLEAVMRQRELQERAGFANELNLVFLNSWGRPFDPKYVNEALHKVLERAGLPRTGMHSLRHSAATFMLMAGLNLHQVSRYLGHSQITLTSNLYGHVLEGAMREAAQKLQDAYSKQ